MFHWAGIAGLQYGEQEMLFMPWLYLSTLFPSLPNLFKEQNFKEGNRMVA